MITDNQKTRRQVSFFFFFFAGFQSVMRTRYDLWKREREEGFVPSCLCSR